MEEIKPLNNKRIGILGKGGAGKSTVAVLVATALRKYGYEVCLLDADSTNVGLHQVLGFERQPASMIDYFGGMIFSGGAVTCPVDDPTPLLDADLLIEELPSAYFAKTGDGIYLLTAGKIGDLGPGAGCDGPISKIARDLRFLSKAPNLVTLVDFKAGFEDTSRGVLTGLDWILVVVDPSNAAIQMAIHMKEMIKKIQAGEPPSVEHIEDPQLAELAKKLFKESTIKGLHVVLNRIRDHGMEIYIRERIEGHHLEITGVIPEDPSITTHWLQGTSITNPERVGEAEKIVSALERLATSAQKEV